MFDFGIKLGSLFSEEISFEVIFREAVVFLRVLDKILGSLGVLLPQEIDVNLQGVGI